jgi:Nucleoside 2-deoxyribosyltransferase like
MARVLKPPAPLVLAPGEPSVFLAGSIEMGRAEPWQAAVEQALADLPVAVLNPRRDSWDASWEQSIDNPAFREQVEWELEAQERATVIAMYFAPATRAPVTLLELGLSARTGKLLVCCPSGFWRRGNVEVVCARYGIPLFADLTALVSAVRERVRAGPSAPAGTGAAGGVTS